MLISSKDDRTDYFYGKQLLISKCQREREKNNE